MKKVLSFILCLAISSVVLACYKKKQAVDANATLNSANPVVKEVVVKEKAPKKITKKKVAKVKAE